MYSTYCEIQATQCLAEDLFSLEVPEPDYLIGFKEAVTVEERVILALMSLHTLRVEQMKDSLLKSIQDYISNEGLLADAKVAKQIQDIQRRLKLMSVDSCDVQVTHVGCCGFPSNSQKMCCT